MTTQTSVTTLVPDDHGRFGAFGGQFVPETLMSALKQLEQEYARAKADPAFQAEFQRYLVEYAGRPSLMYFAERLTKKVGGAKIYLKREDLNHTGAHKVNNVLGQALLAVRMGKKRVIAETGAGQHGVATATAAAAFGLECDVYMGSEDVRRQELNVYRMRLLGTRVIAVNTGQKTLKDAINDAMRDWMASVDYTHYVFGTVAGPHPFPEMVRDFQSVIGRESKQQLLEREGRLPDCVVACVGGGSNAAGMFFEFINDHDVELVGVEAGGRSMNEGDHAATICQGSPGVLHGMHTYVLQDRDGQTSQVHSVSAGLDYPGVGPEHSYWAATGRVQYTSASDDESIEAFKMLARTEGIIPALESSHAVVEGVKRASKMSGDQIVLINLSGRGDKDCLEVARIEQERQQ